MIFSLFNFFLPYSVKQKYAFVEKDKQQAIDFVGQATQPTIVSPHHNHHQTLDHHLPSCHCCYQSPRPSLASLFHFCRDPNNTTHQ